MVPKLFFSQSSDALVGRLIEEISTPDPMETRTLLVPNGEMRQWLLLEIAKRTGIAMGLKVITIEQFFCPVGRSLDLFCLIYSALKVAQESELISYLDGKKKRLIDLSGQLSAFFVRYSQYEPLLVAENSWQYNLFRKLCVPQNIQIDEPMICFGVDFLPPCYWQALSQAPSLSMYLFSPCVEFWEDLCTDRERIKWKKGSKEWDGYLRAGPRNLANWGKLGRKTLSLFDVVESEELYLSFEPTTLLKRIQYDLLTFQETRNPKIDNSVQVHLTGSSRLREVEALKQEILRLDVPYHDISVLAPDIEPYIPLIEYVFGGEIPYRIAQFDIAPQSAFRQGLMRLLALGSSRWDAEEILTLFETPSFYRKQGWDADALNTFRTWVSSVRVHWGVDATHRQNFLQGILGDKQFVDEGSWEKGLDALLEQIVFLKPVQIDPDLFEEFLSVLFALKELDLKGEKSLWAWSDSLEKAAHLFLQLNSHDEADTAAFAHFRTLLLDMRKFPAEHLYPFEVVQHFLTRPCISQIHASKLHAVRIAPITEGALIPAKALFLNLLL